MAGGPTLIRISADGRGRAQPRARSREDEWASEREVHRATEVKRQFLQRHLELLVQRVDAQEEYLQSVTAASWRGMRNETRQEITIQRLCHVLETRRRRAVVWRAFSRIKNQVIAGYRSCSDAREERGVGFCHRREPDTKSVFLWWSDVVQEAMVARRKLMKACQHLLGTLPAAFQQWKLHLAAQHKRFTRNRVAGRLILRWTAFKKKVAFLRWWENSGGRKIAKHTASKLLSYSRNVCGVRALRSWKHHTTQIALQRRHVDIARRRLDSRRAVDTWGLWSRLRDSHKRFEALESCVSRKIRKGQLLRVLGSWKLKTLQKARRARLRRRALARFSFANQTAAIRHWADAVTNIRAQKRRLQKRRVGLARQWALCSFQSWRDNVWQKVLQRRSTKQLLGVLGLGDAGLTWALWHWRWQCRLTRRSKVLLGLCLSQRERTLLSCVLRRWKAAVSAVALLQHSAGVNRNQAADAASWWLACHLARQDAFRHWLGVVTRRSRRTEAVLRFMRRRLLALISRMYRQWLSSGSQSSSLGDESITSSEGDYAEGSGQVLDSGSQRDDRHGLTRVWERSQRAAAPDSLQNGRDEGLAKWEEYKRQACAGADMLPRDGRPSHTLMFL